MQAFCSIFLALFWSAVIQARVRSLEPLELSNTYTEEGRPVSETVHYDHHGVAYRKELHSKPDDPKRFYASSFESVQVYGAPDVQVKYLENANERIVKNEEMRKKISHAIKADYGSPQQIEQESKSERG